MFRSKEGKTFHPKKNRRHEFFFCDGRWGPLGDYTSQNGNRVLALAPISPGAPFPCWLPVQPQLQTFISLSLQFDFPRSPSGLVTVSSLHENLLALTRDKTLIHLVSVSHLLIFSLFRVPCMTSTLEPPLLHRSRG